MKRLFILLTLLCMLQVFSSCKNRSVTEESQLPLASVKVSPVSKGDIEKEIYFNGTSVYLKKTEVISPISGYLVNVNVKFGQEVVKDEILFEIETRERKALAADPDASDNIGLLKVKSVTGGFISELNVHEQGGFVVEGAVLCSIADSKDIMVQVNVPFEYNSLLTKTKKCRIELSDNTVFNGNITRILPVVDETNQTQTILVKPETDRQIPENLNMRVRFIIERHSGTLLVPRSSLMANETQSDFWVMKIEGGMMAVKIPVTKGLVNDTVAEIFSPFLKINDLIISEGAYGLPDSTSITIEK